MLNFQFDLIHTNFLKKEKNSTQNVNNMRHVHDSVVWTDWKQQQKCLTNDRTNVFNEMAHDRFQTNKEQFENKKE